MIRCKLLLCVCFAGIVLNAKAQLSSDYVNYVWVADSLYAKGNYTSAAKLYNKICDLPSFIPRYNYYLAACCYTKIGKPDSALLYLEKGAKKGERLTHRKDIDSDTILIPLHKLKGWDAVRNSFLYNFDAFEHDPGRNDSLRKVLLEMQEKDQRIRHRMFHDSSYQSLNKHVRDSLDNELDKYDKETEVEFKNILNKFGWPGLKMVGFEGESAAWLIAQHSSLDTTFQVSCLKKMMQAMLNYDSQLNNIAYLQDRILLHEGKEQIYGTQFMEKKTAQGPVLVPQSLWDTKNVNKRRHAIQLNSLEDYLSDCEKNYGFKK